MCMVGQNRVSGARGEWNVSVNRLYRNCMLAHLWLYSIYCRDATYTFSPLSGLIYRHTIESIRPAPHVAFYDMMRESLHRLIGDGSAPRVGGVGGKVPATTSSQPDTK